MKKLLLFFLILVSLAACKNDNNNPQPDNNTDTIKQAKYNNESYGTDSRNIMDVYLPAKRTDSTPFVILIHGGGWNSGNGSDFNALQDSLLIRGIASASISYRYASGAVHYEELMEDVDNAVNYIKENSTKWQIKSTGFVMGGNSAGGHMSLLYAYKYDTDNDLKAVISVNGPTDITDIDWLNAALVTGLITSINNMVGAAYNILLPLDALFSLASPIKTIKNVPTLMLHGDADVVVPYSQSVALHNKLQAAGYTGKLVNFPGTNHDLGITIPANYQKLLTEITNWANEYGE